MKRVFLFIFLFVVCFFFVAHVFAGEQNYPLFTRSEYFSIYTFPDIDNHLLLKKINIQSLFHVHGLSLDEDSPRDIVAKVFDTVYLEVSDTLGISVYSFEGKIKIFPDQQALNEEFRSIFGHDFQERAFYVHEKSTLYISFEDLTIGMLAHEMAHMIISNYFIVPPSPKLQEILSGYVEYHFRKYL